MNANVTAADYAWIEEWGLGEAYCLTLVRGLTPHEFLTRINAELDDTPHRLDDFVERSFDAWDHFGGARQYIGAIAVPGDDGDWVLAIEANGYLGVTDDVILPASAGTTLISHYRNVNAVDRFMWVEDGQVQVDFEPLFAAHREGDAPDALVTAMTEAGFDLREFEDDEEDDRDLSLITAAAFALAHRLTGVAVTQQLLDEATYVCGTAPIPGMPLPDHDSDPITDSAAYAVDIPTTPSIVKSLPTSSVHVTATLIARPPDPDSPADHLSGAP